MVKLVQAQCTEPTQNRHSVFLNIDVIIAKLGNVYLIEHFNNSKDTNWFSVKWIYEVQYLNGIIVEIHSIGDGYLQTKSWTCLLRQLNHYCVPRTIGPLGPSHNDPDIAYNNLKQPGYPALPEKRGSTLLRNNPAPAVLVGSPAPNVSTDSQMWEAPAPLPPPRREARPLDPGLSGNAMEAVPLRSGDLLLDNGNETILVRGNNARPVNISA